MPNPSNEEQLFLELINRTRMDPDGQAARLLNVQANIQSAISFFGVNTAAFISQMAAYGATHPLAWHSQLADAADGHSQQMITHDEQSHQLPGEPNLGARVTNAGYVDWTSIGENVYAFTDDPLQGHAGFLIDWGYDDEDFDGNTLKPDWKTLGDGMQDPPGHRNTIMHGNFDEIGIGILADNSNATEVGPLVVTQVFATRLNYQAQFVGSVIDDLDGDDFYDIGEGLGGVTVTVRAANGTTYTTTTWASGGYQIVVPNGSYTLTFSGGGLNGPVSKPGTLAGENVYVSAENPAQDSRHDYNGDGFSDILWRHSGGAVTHWLSNGNTLSGSGNASISVPLAWSITGDGDFNGDGRDDVLWRDSSGLLSYWTGNPAGFLADAYLAAVAPSWQVAGTGDFNGDQRDDILWRNSNGAITSWNSTGTSFAANAQFSTSVATSWQVAGTGDFNKDGLDDILWRSSTGAITSWLSTGTSFAANGAFFATVDISWQVAGIGDFNNDGADDIVWRHSSGALTTWLASGNSFNATGTFFASAPTSWQITGTGDINGDGADDLIWRHSSGALTHWEAFGAGFDNSQPVYGVGTDWTLQPDLLV